MCAVCQSVPAFTKAIQPAWLELDANLHIFGADDQRAVDLLRLLIFENRRETPAVDTLRDFSADLCALQLMGAAARYYFTGICWVFSLLFVLGGKQNINLYANGEQQRPPSECIHKMNNLFAFLERGEI